MRRRMILAVVFSLVLLALPAAPVVAGHDDDPATKNLHALGHIEEPASLLTGEGGGNIHTDIAFWGKYAFQGAWLGFNIRDISAPGNPKHVSFTECQGNQGDVVVWENVLVRSWNSPATGTQLCDGTTVPVGFEGLHVFDISDPNDPVLVASVDLSSGAIANRCGSHTATGVPDRQRQLAGVQLGQRMRWHRHRRGAFGQPGGRGLYAYRDRRTPVPRHQCDPG